MKISRENGTVIFVEVEDTSINVYVDNKVYNGCYPTIYDGKKVMFFYKTPFERSGILLKDDEYEEIWENIFNSNNSHDLFDINNLYKANKMIDSFGKLKVTVGDMNNEDEIIHDAVYDVPVIFYKITNSDGIVTNIKDVSRVIPTYIIDDIVVKYKATGEWYYSYSPENRTLTKPQIESLEFINTLKEVAGFGIEYMSK